ncbi:MAG: aspartate/glutamate racemase family protein [Vulcanimicrobiaceae bacterium]
MRDRPTLGLIGGLGLGAGIYYYRQLVNEFEERGEALSLLFAHADVRRVLGHVRAGEVRELTAYLRAIMESLSVAGCDVAAISAVTPHVCIAELMDASPLPIVNLLDAVGASIQECGMQRIALFGTRLVIETDLFGCLSGVDVVRPNADEIACIARARGSHAGRARALQPRATRCDRARWGRPIAAFRF